MLNSINKLISYFTPYKVNLVGEFRSLTYLPTEPILQMPPGATRALPPILLKCKFRSEGCRLRWYQSQTGAPWAPQVQVFQMVPGEHLPRNTYAHRLPSSRRGTLYFSPLLLTITLHFILVYYCHCLLVIYIISYSIANTN